jgi:hypothetical protein
MQLSQVIAELTVTEHEVWQQLRMEEMIVTSEIKLLLQV